MSFETVEYRECSCRTCHRTTKYRRDTTEGPEWKCVRCGESNAVVTPEQQDASLREFASEVAAVGAAIAKAEDDATDGIDSCPRCGSSTTWVECEMCEDGFDGHDCGEDCCACANPEPNVVCGFCKGEGGYYRCLSSPEWCEAHPLPGKEDVPRCG